MGHMSSETTTTIVDLFAKCDNERTRMAKTAKSMRLFPYFLEMGSEAGPEVLCEGERVITFGSNNYLGLSADPRVKKAAADAVERFGTGCTGSRLLNGTLSVHVELEEALLEWQGGEACLVFTTGYSVNLGLLSALVDRQDRVFLDAGAHASLLDGAQITQGSVRLFKHNSTSTLRRRLEAWRDDDEARGGALVAVDAVFSMEGDLCPVTEMVEVCNEMGARLLVDEAHSAGVLGPEGRGLAAAEGVDADLIMGTFSKSFASCGGFLIAPQDVVDYLKLACRPFLFTAAGVPAAMAAAHESLKISLEEPWRRETALALAERLRAGLDELGYETGPVGSTIVSLSFDSEWKTGRLWRALLDDGIYVNLAVPPAVPAGKATLRASTIATHTEEQVDRALAAFEAHRSIVD